MKTCLWDNKELPKGRRRYCSDECAQQYFAHKIAPLWWINAKNIALESANHCCLSCGSIAKEVHHIIPLEFGESYHNSQKNKQANLQPLCRACHEKAHHLKHKASLIAKEAQLALIPEDSDLAVELLKGK